MDWWDVLTLYGVMGATVGLMGTVYTLVRHVPWRKDWYVGGYP